MKPFVLELRLTLDQFIHLISEGEAIMAAIDNLNTSVSNAVTAMNAAIAAGIGGGGGGGDQDAAIQAAADTLQAGVDQLVAATTIPVPNPVPVPMAT